MVTMGLPPHGYEYWVYIIFMAIKFQTKELKRTQLVVFFGFSWKQTQILFGGNQGNLDLSQNSD